MKKGTHPRPLFSLARRDAQLRSARAAGIAVPEDDEPAAIVPLLVLVLPVVPTLDDVLPVVPTVVSEVAPTVGLVPVAPVVPTVGLVVRAVPPSAPESIELLVAVLPPPGAEVPFGLTPFATWAMAAPPTASAAAVARVMRLCFMGRSLSEFEE